MAEINFALGEKEEAFANLERAYEDKSAEIPYLKVSLVYDDQFRSDPRFEELLKKVGIECAIDDD